MFEPQNQPTPPQPVEDIFNQTGRTARAIGVVPGATSRPALPPSPRVAGTAGASGPLPPSPPSSSADFETKEGIRPKPFIIGGVVLLILALVILGIWFFFLRDTGAPPVDLDREEASGTVESSATDPDDELPPVLTSESTTEPEPTTDSEEPSSSPDTDGDGLTDAEESALGTNPRTADTDGDQLFDKEERDVYGSDPLNPDSDGDGFIDGTEVRNGFNPVGSGRLFEVPTAEPE